MSVCLCVHCSSDTTLRFPPHTEKPHCDSETRKASEWLVISVQLDCFLKTHLHSRDCWCPASLYSSLLSSNSPDFPQESNVRNRRPRSFCSLKPCSPLTILLWVMTYVIYGSCSGKLLGKLLERAWAYAFLAFP